MSVLLIFALSLVQQADIASHDPSRGYETVLNFSGPELVNSQDGVYARFQNAYISAVPGQPLLPCVTLLIPIPPGQEPRLTCVASDVRATGLDEPPPRARALSGDGLDAVGVEADPVPAPTAHAVLQGVLPMAGTRVAVVNVYPITGENGTRYASRLELQLSWDSAPGGIPVERNPLLRLIAPQGCLYWKTGTDQTYESVFWGKPWARISILESGGYQVTGSQLEASGCQVTGSPVQSLRMYTGPGIMFDLDQPDQEHQLHEVSISVSDLDGDGIFDDEDYLRFFGRGLSRWYMNDQQVRRLQHRYATDNVYWLTWGGQDGARMGQVQGQPDTSPGWGDDMYSDLWLREENIWEPKYETSTGWVWQSVSIGEDMTVPFQVGEGGRSQVTVIVDMDEAGSHTAEFSMNGQLVREETWSGSGLRTIVLNDLQLSGSCDLKIRLTDDQNQGTLSLVSVHVQYPAPLSDLPGRFLFPSREKTGRFLFHVSGVSGSGQAFDLTDHYNPVAVTGGEHSQGDYDFSFDVDSATVLAVMDNQDWMTPDSISSSDPGRLVGTVGSGDRLIVVHPSMLDGIWPLRTILQQQGHVPVVATTSEIYDEFGQGVADPGAIRSAVRWAMDSWDPGLSGLILAGDGHYDFLGHSTSQPVMVPVWLDLGSYHLDVVDDSYAMVHSGSQLPEVPVSRIPADNLSQLGTCTAKLLEYQSGDSRGDWTDRALIIADDEWGQGTNTSESVHTVHCELISEEVLPRWINRDKFYLIEYPWPPGTSSSGPHPEKPEARADLLETLDQGSLLTYYEGHGAANQIAHEVIMLDEDVSGLQNDRRLPLSLWATCDVGSFDSPGTDAIAELLVLHPAGGAIASIAATRGTQSSYNYALFRSVMDSLFNHDGLTVGDALWQSKLSQSGNYSINNKYYVLFGYTDLTLPMPEVQGTVSVSGDTLISGQMNTISGSGFPQDGLTFVNVLESSFNTVYTGLDGIEIPYLKYGGTAYSGTQNVSGGEFSLDCFVPIQSRAGDMARAASCAIGGDRSAAGAVDPAVLVNGSPSGDDLLGPDVDMWIRGYEGIQNPRLTGEITLEAEITDSSGICLLGGTGKELNLFIDGSGNDVSDYFSYHRGSAVSGRLEYVIEPLSEGEHRLILWSVDGVGNSSRDTLDLTVLQETELAISQALVYPNPGIGERCFSFRISEAARVTLSIYTVAGTRIDEISRICDQGYNQIIWNGLDHDGDPVASGPYIYKIKADALSTSVFDNTAEDYGIMAVIGEE